MKIETASVNIILVEMEERQKVFHTVVAFVQILDPMMKLKELTRVELINYSHSIMATLLST